MKVFQGTQRDLVCLWSEARCSRAWHCCAGWVARVGSACFLFVQMLMLLDFVTNWNDAWVDKEDDRCAYHMCHV